MENVRSAIARVEAAIHDLDPDCIVQGTFYDDVSNRLFVTVVKGPRKKLITLLGRYFGNGFDAINKTLKTSIEELQTEPIG